MSATPVHLILVSVLPDRLKRGSIRTSTPLPPGPWFGCGNCRKSRTALSLNAADSGAVRWRCSSMRLRFVSSSRPWRWRCFRCRTAGCNSVSGVAFQTCQPLPAMPDGVSPPADFSATSILDCQRSVFGLPISRMLLASRVIREGVITRTSQFAHALDRNGQPVRIWSLDDLLLPLLIALRLWLDRGQGSSGRRICRIRMSSSSNAEVPRAAMIKRYVAQLLPLLPFWLSAVFGAAANPGQLFDAPWLLIALIVAGVPSLIAAFEALSAIVGEKTHITIGSPAPACCASTKTKPPYRRTSSRPSPTMAILRSAGPPRARPPDRATTFAGTGAASCRSRSRTG